MYVYDTLNSQYKQKYKDKWSTDLDRHFNKEEWVWIHSMPFKITQDTTLRWLQLGIEFYLFVSHGGMKRQRVHV